MAITLVNQDCFDFLPKISDASVDLVICDLPYGTTQCRWDCRLPLEKLWEQLWRVAKIAAPVLMFASQPFTSVVVMSQMEHFKYEWIWEKSKASNFLDANKRPLKSHESVLVFCRQPAPYFPQMSPGAGYKARPGKKITDVYGAVKDPSFRNNNDGQRYPRSVVYYKTAETEGEVIHSTQKPVALLEYLIATYTQSGHCVLDPCCGSATSALASGNLGRLFIGCEIDKEMHYKSVVRLKNHGHIPKESL